MKTVYRFGRGRSRAAALVIVLCLVVFLSLLVVSLTVAMRMERQSSHYFAQRTQADMLAREGLEYVKAILQESTTTNAAWISSPGRIISLSNNTVYPLYSGTNINSGSPPVVQAADLNHSVITEDNLAEITGQSAADQIPMRVAWIYVRQDGTRETNNTPTSTDSANPIIGRFAFWADDESSRINLNSAWKRQNNTNAASSTSLVNLLALSGLTEATADFIRSNASIHAWNSPNEIDRLGAQMSANFSGTNRFFVTDYSHSDLVQLNPWGEPRFVLTTQRKNLPPSLANRADVTNYFLDILKSDNLDPGIAANLTATKVTSQIQRLMDLFGRKLPYASNSTFIEKYGYASCVCLAVNLIDYVRSAESSNNVVPPIRVAVDGSNSFKFGGDINETNPNIFVGSSRRPMLTEVAVWFDQTPTPTASGNRWIYNVRQRVEFCLPKSYGMDTASWETMKYRLACWYPNPDGTQSSITEASLDNVSPSSFQTFDDGNQTIAVVDFAPIRISVTNTNRPSTVWLRAQFPLDAGSAGQDLGKPFWEIAPAYTGDQTNLAYTNYLIKCPVNDLVSYPAGSSAQIGDPRLNKYQTNWGISPSTWGTMRRSQAGDLSGTPLGVSPPQDQDGGVVSDAALSVPPPIGKAGNALGVVISIGEIGYICSGQAQGVPWRSLRFQPRGGSPPDWAMVDLFAIPNPLTNQPWNYQPRSEEVAGRININAFVTPFTNLTPPMTRTIPLKALFLGAKTNLAGARMPESHADLVASNVVAMQWATNGNDYRRTNYYESLGELCEIAGIADAGEQSEELFRQISNQATLQGNVFRVFSVGQAIQQTPAGKLVIQAERSAMAQVERYLDNGKVGTRTVFWKNLSP